MDSETWPEHSNGRLTINLDAIVWNWKKLSGMADHGNCGAVVKADAYGLGAARIAASLYKAGCRDFFTATIHEGMVIRPHVGEARIHVFNGFNPQAFAKYRDHRLVPILNSPVGIHDWIAMRENGMECALHVDTGMNRLGLTEDEFSILANKGDVLKSLNPSLVISHFACADEPDHPLNRSQIKRFGKIAELFPDAVKSLANSAGVFLDKGAHFDLLRPGIALYGAEAVNNVPNPMKPAVKLEGRIIQLKQAKKGETVGYGAPEKLERETKIAVVGIGYADGLHRAASGAGTLFRDKVMSPGGMGMIGGYRVPVLGRISMDLVTFDVTDVPETLIGKNGWIELIGEDIRVDDLARAAGTIGYEILTSLGRRYERIYTGG